MILIGVEVSRQRSLTEFSQTAHLVLILDRLTVQHDNATGSGADPRQRLYRPVGASSTRQARWPSRCHAAARLTSVRASRTPGHSIE